MRVAFIGQKGIPAKSGGIEKHVEEVAKRMAKMGHEVFVYARNNYTDKNLETYEGVKIVHLPSISTKNLDAITHTFLATLHALFQRYDVVHYHGIGPTSMSLLFRILNPKTALIATFHCQDYYHQKWGIIARAYLRLGEYITCKIPNKTITVSEVLSQWAKEKYGSLTTTIPNGAEVKYSQEVDALSQFGIKDKKYILSVGRLIKHKGVHYLIEAFKALEDASKLPNNFKLVIVGDGFHTDDYVKYLHTISEGRDNIIFTGAQQGEVLQQLFSHAYLFVQPSESEGLSIALLEAMGYGLTPLVSDIKENLEPVGENGFSFESKNVKDLRDKLAYLVSRNDEVERIGKNAKEKIETQYSWDSIAQKTIEVYKGVIENA